MWPHDRYRSVEMFETNFRESSRFDGAPRLAIGMASVREKMEPRTQAVLPLPQARARRGRNVLDENKSSAGFEHAHNFRERDPQIRHRAKYERADNSIGGTVRALHCSGVAIAQFRRDADTFRFTLQIHAHVRIRLDANPANSVRVVAQIRTGSRTDFNHGARQPAK